MHPSVGGWAGAAHLLNDNLRSMFQNESFEEVVLPMGVILLCHEQGLACFRFGICVVQAFGVLKLWGLGFKGGLLDEQEKKESVLMMGVVVGMTYKLGEVYHTHTLD